MLVTWGEIGIKVHILKCGIFELPDKFMHPLYPLNLNTFSCQEIRGIVIELYSRDSGPSAQPVHADQVLQLG